MPAPFYVRDFLNRPGHHQGAYVIAAVDIDDGRDPSEALLEADLRISDCSRTVLLDFVASNAAEVENSLHKARLLRSVVDDFVVALEQACAEVQERWAAGARGERMDDDVSAG